MPVQLNTTPEDHIPEEFTIESLMEGGLTEQEIAALSEGDDPVVTAAAKPAEGEAGGGDSEEIDATVGTAPPAQEGEAQTQEAEAAAQAQAQQVAAEQANEPPAPEEDTIEIPEIPDISEAKEFIGTVDDKLDALSDQYDDGEMTREEFKQAQREITKQAAKAQAQIDEANRIANEAMDKVRKHWAQNLESYKELAGGLWEQEHFQKWDRHLRAVTGSEDPAIQALSRRQQIQLAHRNYASEYETLHGKPLSGSAALPTASTAAKQEQAQQKKAAKPREDDRPEAPTTLSGLNSDGTDEIEDSAFAAIDRTVMKDPVRAEEMLMSLSEEQRERFLNEV